MAIHFISGKPRVGKSMYAVKLIVDELVYGSRPVYTNVPLDIGRLNEYLQQKFPHKSIDVVERVVLLTDEQTLEFFTYRPGGIRIARLSKDRWSAGDLPSYREVKDSGVFYAIDEIHNFFNARQWAETGRDVLFYLSQHGHLGDTVIAVTQHIGNVDKQFRSVSQDYTYLRNLSKEKMGLFKMPGIFLRKTYIQPATDLSEPMETGTFKLDVSGLASCYSTVGGVGIHSRGEADKGESRRGLPWWVFVVGVPLLIWALLHFVPQVLGAVTSPNIPKQIQKQPGASAGTSSQPMLAATSSIPVTASVIPQTNAVRVVGGAVFGQKILCAMSDGSVRSSERAEVRPSPFGRGFIVLGLYLRWKEAE